MSGQATGDVPRAPLPGAADEAVAEAYLAPVLAEVQRVLGMLDREALSPTSGCCDRTFWAWKFVDFPRARFQECACVLSFLFAVDFPGNPYRRDRRLGRWIGAALDFWTGLQHGDGSFDEAYPNERALAATAFTSFYVAEALRFLGDELEPGVRARVLATLGRAGDWLCANDETHGFLSNHLAAAAAALAHAAALLGAERFRARSAHFVRRILERQSPEGWYEEYGGADPGYQTHGSFYLARLVELGAGAELAASLARAADFLALCVHPDGSLGGEYGSRNTRTYYPAAFELCAARSPSAAWIAETMRPSVASGAAAGLGGIDSYNYFPFLNNLVFAYLARRGRGSAPAVEPRAAERFVWLPLAGLARVRTARYDAWIGTSKGGVVNVFDRRARRLVHADAGYVGAVAGGGLASTQYLDRGRNVRASAEAIEVEGELRAFRRPTPDPVRFLCFRLFSLTLGRFPRASAWLKRLLVRVLIEKSERLDVAFRRAVRFEEDAVVVVDELRGRDGARLTGLRRGDFFTTIHMGSARYFVPGELSARMPDEEGPADFDPQALQAGLRSERRLAVG